MAATTTAGVLASLAGAVPAEGNWWDALNPFAYLAGQAGKVVADGWTAAMLGLWNAGLWMLRLVLGLTDTFLVPDLSESGPGAPVYRTTVWIAVTLVVALGMVQLGVAAVRRDGASLSRLAVGFGQFVIVWAGWIGYGVAVVAACGGLTQSLMEQLLGATSWSGWRPWEAFSTKDIADGTVATVLGLMGLLLFLAAIGHLLVMLTRAGALIVLATTTPICAAGLVGELGVTWFWKSFRWFHAAAFTPVVLILTLGIGVQMTSGVATGMTDDLQKAIGTALPGVVLILVACFSPLALFKLLAFVDPGTSSGAGLRRGLAAHGGVQGLLGGGGSPATSDAASTTDEYGRSEAETSAQASTSARVTQGAGGLRGAFGAAGGVAAATLGVLGRVGTAGAAIGSDLTNQMGVGHQTYHPDFSPAGRRTAGASSSGGGGSSSGGGGATETVDPSGAAGIDTAAAGIAEHTPAQTALAPPTGGGVSSGRPSSGGASSPGGSSAAGAVDSAAGEAALGAAAL